VYRVMKDTAKYPNSRYGEEISDPIYIGTYRFYIVAIIVSYLNCASCDRVWIIKE